RATTVAASPRTSVWRGSCRAPRARRRPAWAGRSGPPGWSWPPSANTALASRATAAPWRRESAAPSAASWTTPPGRRFADGTSEAGALAGDVELPDGELELRVGEERLGVGELDGGAEAGAETGLSLRVVGARGVDGLRQPGQRLRGGLEIDERPLGVEL